MEHLYSGLSESNVSDVVKDTIINCYMDSEVKNSTRSNECVLQLCYQDRRNTAKKPKLR